MPKRGKPTKRPPRKPPAGGDEPKRRRSARERVSSLRHHDREPSSRHEPGPFAELLQMMGIVALVVIVVILVFFALGYAFGRYLL